MSVTIHRPGALDSAGSDAGNLSPAGPVQLSDLLITPELFRREPKAPDHAAENCALVALAREMSDHPRSLPQKLVEVAVQLCQAGSAGISLLRNEGGKEIFFWEALAGAYAPYVGGTTPRDFSPCGVTLDRGAPQLFFYPARLFEYFQAAEPPIVEGLIIPFYAGGRPLGTIWIVSHDEGRRFDAEDLRVMTSLAEFTGTALQVLSSLDAMTSAHAELEQAREVLQESDRRKDEFLATLAHELRNPLAPVRNSLHILRVQEDRAVQDHALEVIDRQVQHLVRLVDDLLEVSRITRGKLELRKEPIELTPVLLSAVETSRPLIETAGHELTIRLPDQPILLEGDPVRLAQLLSNLLNNAAKYTESGGSISLSAVREGDEAVIQVQDSGIGIAPDMLPRVFEMFIQVDGSQRRSHGGLGIGLALVRTLVQMHGGRVEAHSPGPDQGSTFTVRLPVLDGQRRDAANQDCVQCAGASAWPARRILVVDDNRDSAESMGSLLECMGSEVEVAHDGQSALQAIDSYQPAVVLLDIGMPGMDGYEVARRVRERRDLDHVTLIAVTGWGQEEDQRRSREAGFDHHLVKPVDLEALRALLAVS